MNGDTLSRLQLTDDGVEPWGIFIGATSLSLIERLSSIHGELPQDAHWDRAVLAVMLVLSDGMTELLWKGELIWHN